MGHAVMLMNREGETRGHYFCALFPSADSVQKKPVFAFRRSGIMAVRKMPQSRLARIQNIL